MTSQMMSPGKLCVFLPEMNAVNLPTALHSTAFENPEFGWKPWDPDGFTDLKLREAHQARRRQWS